MILADDPVRLSCQAMLGGYLITAESAVLGAQKHLPLYVKPHGPIDPMGSPYTVCVCVCVVFLPGCMYSTACYPQSLNPAAFKSLEF